MLDEASAALACERRSAAHASTLAVRWG